MLFHSWMFLAFFAVFYPVFLLLKGTRAGLYWLLAASYVFYASWNSLYLALIAYVTVLDYLLVVIMSRSRRKKMWIVVSVLSNFSLLGFFKYAGFFTENLNLLLSSMGWAYRIPAPDILLPVGISFFTFMSMSYTIDFYRGRIEREPSFIRFAAFVSLFPHLVAGPILRARDLLPQLHRTPKVTAADVTDGMSLFLTGFFKKVALADYLALYVDKVYGAPGAFGGADLILATFAFAWQIYFDFSGYTDMARGIARMMGYKFILNFNNPYLATSLGDFWNRWHISLSTWFRDYVYIPLGGNRGGRLRTYRNMVLTMLVSGLWHGANWTFVIWGGLHAAGRVATRELEQSRFYADRIPKLAKQLGVFTFILFTWIFFRAHTLADAMLILTRIFTSPWQRPCMPILAMAMILMVWLYQFMQESKLKSVLQLAPVKVATASLMIVYAALFSPSGVQPFIYFQF